MNKTELIAAIVEKTGVAKKDAVQVVDAFTEVVTAELKKGGDLRLVGFGTFKVKARSARTGINPQTKEKIKIAASKAPAFVASSALKAAVKEF